MAQAPASSTTSTWSATTSASTSRRASRHEQAARISWRSARLVRHGPGAEPVDVHADAVRRLRELLARRAGPPPELLEVERGAEVAMTPCTCGHPWHDHEHYYPRTECASCACERFRPALPAGTVPMTGQRHGAVVRDLVVRARVLRLTHSWRDRHGA